MRGVKTSEFQAWAKGEPGRAVRDIMLRHIRKEIVLLIAACTDPWVFMILQQDHFRRSVMGYWRGWKVN